MWKLSSFVFLYRPQDEGVAQIKCVCSRFDLWIKVECLLLGVATQTFNPSTMGVNKASGSLLVAFSTKWIPTIWEEKCSAREILVIYKITDRSRSDVTHSRVVILLFYFIWISLVPSKEPLSCRMVVVVEGNARARAKEWGLARRLKSPFSDPQFSYRAAALTLLHHRGRCSTGAPGGVDLSGHTVRSLLW